MGNQGGSMHQAMRTVLHAIDPAFGNALTGFVTALFQTSPFGLNTT